MSALAEVVDLAAIRAGGQRARSITRAEVVERVEAIREALSFSLRGLAELREAEAHIVCGFSTWHEFCEWAFGDLQSLRLTGSPEAVAEREALVWSLREQGTATRAIRERLGVSSYAVNEALRKLDPAPERVEGADGRSRSSRTGRQEPVAALEPPVGARWEQAAEWVRRSAAGLLPGRTSGGLTLGELASVAGWSEGAASGALNRAIRHGVVVRAEGKRGTVRAHYPAEVDNGDKVAGVISGATEDRS